MGMLVTIKTFHLKNDGKISIFAYIVELILSKLSE